MDKGQKKSLQLNRRQKIIVSVVGIFLVLLILVGLTYAYFLTKIQGNSETKSISVTTANLVLVYGDGNGVLESAEMLIPGTDVKFLDASKNVVDSKTFTVTNNGNATVDNYAVILEDVINSLDRPDDMKMVLTCTSDKDGKECNGVSGNFPNNNEIVVLNSIDVGETQSYELKLTYIEAGVDQSVDMNKTITAKINIMDTITTVDVAGTVATYSEGDYVQVNSEPKISYITDDGTYKVVGLLPGNHTIAVYSSTGTKKGSQTFIINKGDTSSVSGSTITIDDKSRTIVIDINSDYSISIDDVLEYAQGSSYSLATNIIKNAKNITTEQKSAGYAEFVSTPPTTPAKEISGSSESVLSVTQDDDGDSYYFRGNVKNNYVNFAGMCWRIVRIAGDGSTKLILEDQDVECNSSSFTGNWPLSLSSYGFTNYKADYDGYVSPENSSVKGLKSVLTSWYNSKLTSYQSKLKSEQSCIGDITTVYSDVYLGWYNPADGYSDDDSSSYEVNVRLSNSYKPTLKCNGEKANSAYIYAITADEVAYAGGTVKTRNINYYLSGGPYAYYQYHTMSPAGILWNHDQDFVVEGGQLVVTNYTSHTRPMITLASGIILNSGDGSQSNPYVIK